MPQFLVNPAPGRGDRFFLVGASDPPQLNLALVTTLELPQGWEILNRDYLVDVWMTPKSGGERTHLGRQKCPEVKCQVSVTLLDPDFKISDFTFEVSTKVWVGLPDGGKELRTFKTTVDRPSQK